MTPSVLRHTLLRTDMQCGWTRLSFSSFKEIIRKLQQPTQRDVFSVFYLNRKKKKKLWLTTVHYLHFAWIMLWCLCVQSAALNIHITVSALMYCGRGKLVPADRLNLDQTLNTMFFLLFLFFLLPFLFGPRIAEQSAARLFCLFGVNEWCVKHLEWCMVSSGELTWGSCLLNKPTVW